MSDDENSQDASKDIFLKAKNVDEEEPQKDSDKNAKDSAKESAKEEEEDSEQKKISKEFHDAVVQYVKLDDKARKKAKEVKELKQEKKQYEDIILNFMETNKENVIEITGGKLRLNKATTKAPLKQETIQQSLQKKLKDQKKAFELTNLIVNDRPMVERKNLKRTNERPKKKIKTKIV